MDEIFSNEVYKGSTFPLFILIVHPNDWKSGLREWLAKGAKSQWFRVVEWCATRWRWCTTCWAVRGLLGGARPVQNHSTVKNYYGRDPLGGLCDLLNRLPADFNNIPQSPFKSSKLFEVGSLHIVLEVNDGCKPSCYDFNLKSCKWKDLYGCNIHVQIVLGFMVFQAVFPFDWFPSLPFCPPSYVHFFSPWLFYKQNTNPLPIPK